jgi:hypothetical protein
MNEWMNEMNEWVRNNCEMILTREYGNTVRKPQSTATSSITNTTEMWLLLSCYIYYLFWTITSQQTENVRCNYTKCHITFQNAAVSSYKCWHRPTICRTDTHWYCKRNYETCIILLSAKIFAQHNLMDY